MDPREPLFTPTPEQIEERAAEVRSCWSEKEESRRSVVKHVLWEIPDITQDRRRRDYSHADDEM